VVEDASRSPRVSARLTLTNARGMHARPCHAVVTTALAHQSTLRVRCGEREVDGRSILSLMTLGAAHGAELELVAEGPDASELLDKLRSLIETGFGEFE